MAQQKFKSDIVFFRAFNEKKEQLTDYLVDICTKPLVIFVALIIDFNVNGQHSSVDLTALILYFFTYAFLLLAYLIQIRKVYGNPKLFLMLANETGHSIASQPINTFTQINQCVSTTFFLAQNLITETTLTEHEKQQYIRKAKTEQQISLKCKMKWIYSLYKIGFIFFFLSAVYSIVMFGTVEGFIAKVKRLILEVFQALVFLIIICCCFWLYQWCNKCYKKYLFNKIQLPEKQVASSDILIVGDDCSICYQTITQQDKIFVLSCSNKHIFHADCLREWIKVKQTCPMCRHDIPMGFYQF